MVYGILAAVLIAILIPILLYSFLLFDRLVRQEYSDYRSQWEQDGRPRGFFWRPQEVHAFDITSVFARSRVMYVWLFSTPEWIARAPVLRSWLRRVRTGVLVWNVGMLALLFLL